MLSGSDVSCGRMVLELWKVLTLSLSEREKKPSSKWKDLNETAARVDRGARRRPSSPSL